MPHQPEPTKDCPECEEPMIYEPADPNYGADADGNRGMYVSACFVCQNPKCSKFNKAQVVDNEPDWLD